MKNQRQGDKKHNKMMTLDYDVKTCLRFDIGVCWSFLISILAS